jgi:hypothetical protein
MPMRFRAKQLIEECENRLSWRSAIGFSVFLASDASSSLRCQRRTPALSTVTALSPESAQLRHRLSGTKRLI